MKCICKKRSEPIWYNPVLLCKDIQQYVWMKSRVFLEDS